ncbi:MAG TPA: hypothetical protein PK569_16080 [Thermoanaerobaculia bacterium]|nr:hypothetical protein [Thermoanaerobaculia bacterium]
MNEALMDLHANEPAAFFEDILGATLTPDQLRVVESVRDNRRTAAPAGHGVGKSFVASGLALWYLVTRPGSKVVTTAPTWRQVEEVLWRELAASVSRARIPIGGWLTNTQLELGPNWFALGLSTDDPTRFQGIHAPWVMIILDEATGIAPEIWDAAEAIAVGPHDRFLAIGNPTDPTSRFKQVCDSGNWNVVEISCEQHPNVLEGRVVVPGAPTREWVAERLEEYGGRDSGLYRARVLGKWPEAGADVLIPLSVVEAAQERWAPPSGRIAAAGCDVARFGSDETVIITIDEAGNASAPIVRVGQDLMATAGHLQHIGAMRTAVDDTGLGGGVTDRLAELEVVVDPVNFGESARDPERFVNRRAELWWGMREALVHGDVALPSDPMTASDLSSVKYSFDSRGRIRLEAKEEIRKRLGRSPDRGDALALAVSAWIAGTRKLDLEITPDTEWAEYGQGATF